MDTAARQGIEAILFLADEPVALDALAEAAGVDSQEVVDELAALSQRCVDEERGVVVREVAGGWRMYSAPGAEPALERWALAGRTGRLSPAALETLAVVAYKQPISRQDIGDIRGVNADAAVRSLVARELLTDVGHDDGPGRAVLYGTTVRFLERLGLRSLDDLPPLTEFLPESPAPDEPALDAIADARRRLADSGFDQNATADGETPAATRAQRRPVDGEMTELTDRLDEVTRSAMARLRSAVATTEQDAGSDGEDASGEHAGDASGEHAGDATDEHVDATSEADTELAP